MKISGLLIPPGVVTTTSLGARSAPELMENVAVNDVPAGFTTMLFTVTPPNGTVTAVVPVRLVPTMVTGTLVP